MSSEARVDSPHDATVSAVGGAMSWSIMARLLQFGLSIVSSILVVRLLGPDRYGLLTVLRTSLAFVAAICGLGLGQAVLRYFPAARARGNRRLASQLVRWTVFPQAVAWAAAVILVLLLGGVISRIAFPEVSRLFLLGTVVVAAELAFLAATNLTTAFYDSRGLSMVTLGGAVSYLLFVSLALLGGLDVAGAILATGASHLLMAVILGYRLKRQIGAIPVCEPGTDISAPSARAVFRYALPFGAIAIMNLITWRQSETIFLAHFHTMREAGYFELAYRIPQMILEFVPGAIWPLLMAGFSEIYSRDSEKLNRAISTYYKILFLLVSPISLLGVSLGDRALVLLYSDQMSPAGPYCQAFFMIFSISFLSTPLSMAFYVLEKPMYSFGIYLVNSILIIGLDFLLIPPLGLLGALIPMAVILSASPFINYYLLRRCGIRPDIPWKFLFRVYLAALPCALLYPARPFLHGTLAVILAVVAALALYLLGLRLFRVLGREEGLLLRRAGVPFAAAISAFLNIRESES